MRPRGLNACVFPRSGNTSPEFQFISMENGNLNYVSLEAREPWGDTLLRIKQRLYLKGAGISVLC